MNIDFTSPTFTPSIQRTWPPLLNLEQTAQILNISKWTLRKWDNEDKLVAIRIGSRKDRRYRKEDVLRVLNNGLS